LYIQLIYIVTHPNIYKLLRSEFNNKKFILTIWYFKILIIQINTSKYTFRSFKASNIYIVHSKIIVIYNKKLKGKLIKIKF